jgi:APA family basic amino acid/polyamine antiporter
VDNETRGASGLRRLFLHKSIAQVQAETEQQELKRTLGPLHLVLLGIGCIIGTGIFVLLGRAAAVYAGPGIMISFVITGTLCAFVALCYAELASMLPVSGSAYSYSYVSMGEIVAWIMGLLLLLEYGLAASTVAVGWSGYLVSLMHDIGVSIAPAWTAAPGVAVMNDAGERIGAGIVNLPALLSICAVTLLLVVGVSESAAVNNVIVVIKLTVIVAFIVLGARHVDPANWAPLIPAEQPPGDSAGAPFWQQLGHVLWEVIRGQNTSHYGLGGVIHAAAVIFFAYLGFEAVSTAGAESRNPKRDLPIGILTPLVICTVLYILTAAVLVGIVPYGSLDNSAPIATAVNAIGLGWFAIFVKIGAIAGLSSVMLVLLYGQTRIFYAMSRDGLLPPALATVHPRFRTPWINTLIVGFVAAAAAGFMSLDILSDVTNVGSLAAFGIVCVTVMYLRYTSPEVLRPFRTPLFPWVPICGIVLCAILLMSLMAVPETRGFFLVYIVVGTAFYFVYSVRHSKLAHGQKVKGHEPAPMELPQRKL